MEKYNESNALQSTIRIIQRLLLCTVLCLSPLAYSAEDTLAVLPLQNQAHPSLGNQSDAAYQVVTESLLKIKRFTLIERNQLDNLIGEAKLQNSGLIDDMSAVALGKQSGARHVIVGSYSGEVNRVLSNGIVVNGVRQVVESFPAKLSLSLRMVDVQTGKIENTFSAQATGNKSAPAFSINEALRDLADKLDRVIANAYPSSGYVIKTLSENEYLIDSGKANGTSKGDEFLLFEQGADLVHPVTGKVIKGEKKILGEGEVTQVDQDTSIVKASGLKQPVVIGKTQVESKEKKSGFWEALKDFTR